MKAAKFDYVRPATLAEALQRLQDGAGATKAMGGSQSLGPMLNLRLARPSEVVDLSALPEMRSVTQQGPTLRIGAAVTHAEVEDGVFPALRGTLMQKVARGIAYRAIRNRGTIGGSLAHADPAADWVLVMNALGAELEITSAGGSRRLPMDRFMHGAYTTDLGEGEAITAVHVAVAGPGARWGYEKFCRKTGEFAEASCCAMFDPQRRFARIVLGALDGAPRALPGLTRAVASTGAMPSTDDIHQAIAEVAPDKDAVGRRLTTAVVRRCLEQILDKETAA